MESNSVKEKVAFITGGASGIGRVWLCSDEASFVTGQALAVDGGWTA